MKFVQLNRTRNPSRVTSVVLYAAATLSNQDLDAFMKLTSQDLSNYQKGQSLVKNFTGVIASFQWAQNQVLKNANFLRLSKSTAQRAWTSLLQTAGTKLHSFEKMLALNSCPPEHQALHTQILAALQPRGHSSALSRLTNTDPARIKSEQLRILGGAEATVDFDDKTDPAKRLWTEIERIKPLLKAVSRKERLDKKYIDQLELDKLMRPLEKSQEAFVGNFAVASALLLATDDLYVASGGGLEDDDSDLKEKKIRMGVPKALMRWYLTSLAWFQNLWLATGRREYDSHKTSLNELVESWLPSEGIDLSKSVWASVEQPRYFFWLAAVNHATKFDERGGRPAIIRRATMALRDLSKWEVPLASGGSVSADQLPGFANAADSDLTVRPTLAVGAHETKDARNVFRPMIDPEDFKEMVTSPSWYTTND